MIEILVIFLLLFITLANYCRYNDVLYPPFIQASLWLLIVILYIINQDFFLPLSGQLYLLILNGVFMFSIGSYLSTYKYHANKSILSLKDISRRPILLNLIFWLPMCGLPFYLYRAYHMGISGPTDSFFVNVRLQNASEALTQTRNLVDYLVTLSFISVGLQLLMSFRKNKNLRFYAALITALTYAIWSTGRTFLLLLFSMIIGILLITRRLNAFKGLFYFVLITPSIFVLVGLFLGKVGSLEQSFLVNFLTMKDSLRTYLLASLPAFDLYMQSDISPEYGSNTFRTILAVLHEIGFNVDVPSLVKEYRYVPMPTNVYTVYQPYFADFSFFGPVFIQFFIGLVYGVVFKKANRGNPFYIFLYGIFLYPLLMQGFQDQYFSLLSTWIQYFIALYIYFNARQIISIGLFRKHVNVQKHEYFAIQGLGK